jgi:hypothetical protein
MSRRRVSSWEGFRKSRITDSVKTTTIKRGEASKNTCGILREEDYLAIKMKHLEKERDIRNASAPLSVGERHYPKEFTIPKKEEDKE